MAETVIKATGEQVFISDEHLAHVQRLIQDAMRKRQLVESEWDENVAMVEGRAKDIFKPADPDEYVDVPIAQRGVHILSAVELRTRPIPSFKARDAGTPPLYLARKEAEGKLSGARGLSLAQQQGQAPITHDQLRAVMGEYAGGIIMPDTGMAVKVSPDDFIQITVDDAVMELEREVKSQWELNGGDVVVGANVQDKLVLGGADTLFQWDDESSTFKLINLNNKNCWVDPYCEWDIQSARYYVIQQPLTLRQAQREFPEASAALADFADKPTQLVECSDAWSIAYANALEGIVPRVWRITVWERDYPVRMTAAEIMNRQSVHKQAVYQEVDLDNGEKRIRHISSGEWIDDDNPLWPTKRILRQLDMVGNIVLYDGPAPHFDINVARNINVKRVRSPYGRGAPNIIKDLYRANNDMMTAAKRHLNQYGYPSLVMPESTAKTLTDEQWDTFQTKAGMRFIGPDHLFEDLGPMAGMGFLQPPPMNPAVMGVFGVTDQKVAESLGLTAALQGAGKSDWSGQSFAKALRASETPIQTSVRHTRHYITHLGKLAASAILRNLDNEEWSRRSGKYSTYAIMAIKQMLSRDAYRVAVGADGATDQADQANLGKELMQSGVVTPTLLKETLEASDMNNARAIAHEYMEMQANIQQAQEQNARRG